MKDCSRRDRELASAAGALPPDRRLGKRIDLGNAAMRAERFAAIRRKPDPLERVERFLSRQPENLSDAQAPCGW